MSENEEVIRMPIKNPILTFEQAFHNYRKNLAVHVSFNLAYNLIHYQRFLLYLLKLSFMASCDVFIAIHITKQLFYSV